VNSALPGMHPDLAAVLLAGGKSRRMGCDKAVLSLGGQPVALLLANRLHEVTDQVLLSTNEPSAYSFLGLTAVADLYPGCGPMAGVHAALRHTARSMVLVLACDLPAVTTQLLRRIIECAEGFDAVVPMTSDGLLHPVCALYRRACLPVIEQNLRSGENQMMALFDSRHLRVRRLPPGEGDFTDANLMDVDSPEDYFQCLARIPHR
jgi:molybdopterin-guanine dinucleotide biosynthesis protein A